MDFSKSKEDVVIQFKSRSMSDPTLSDIDSENKMAWVLTTLKWMRGRLCRFKIIIYFSIHIHQKNKRNIWVHRLDLLYFKLIIGLLMLGDELFNQWLTNQIEPVSLKLFGRFSVYRTSLNYRIIERVIIDSKVFRQLLTILFSV